MAHVRFPLSVVRILRIAAPLALLACGPSSPPPAEAAAIPDERAPALLEALVGDSATAARDAIDEVRAAGDARFVAVFLELLRAAQVEVASPAVVPAAVESLEALTGQGFGRDWRAWLAWYETQELQAPPGFLGFKGRLWSAVDERFGEILRDGLPVRVRPEEIVWGGVAYEGIPALDQPRMVSPEDASWLEDDEPVFGIEINGDARAYPHRILDWHEMTNDVVGGVPVSLAYCTLCGAGVAYDGRAPDGESYDFGSSGWLMRSNKLMVDRQTRTLWNQLTGEPVLGKLAKGELRLKVLPSVVTRWKDWRARHPDTKVLDIETGHRRPYHPGAAYAGYFASEDTMFPVAQRRSLLPKKARIFALERGGVPKAYALDALVREGVVNDPFSESGEAPVVLVARRPTIEVDGRSVRSGPARYPAGAEVRAYEAGSRRFRAGPGPDTLLDANDAEWKVGEAALVGPGGERAERLPGFLAYWFGWNAFHPKTLVWGAPESS